LNIETKTKVFIVEERSNPSTDFFVLPQFPVDRFEVTHCYFKEAVSSSLLNGAIVVFVRYLPNLWRKLVSENRAALKSLYFFMDDDVLDFSASKGMPLRYRWKLLKMAGRHKSWLLKQKASLWVSTPYLQNKYQAWSAEHIEPQPIQPIKESVKIFYHGSASHNAEIEWLFPIVKTLVERNTAICFEIIGGQSVYKKFKSLPGVQVVHPMGWEAYQYFIQQPGRHIGLAPLLDNTFNQARSYTKVFDITQAGAVGVYSVGSESARYVSSKSSIEQSDTQAGIVLPLDQKLWIEKIEWLVNNHHVRNQMASFAQRCLNDKT